MDTPGIYLRRLRIELGYDFLNKILKYVPGLHTLYLGLNISDWYTTKGLQKAMKAYINPAHLLLDFGSDSSNMTRMNRVTTVLRAASRGIRSWSNLVRCHAEYLSLRDCFDWPHPIDANGHISRV